MIWAYPAMCRPMPICGVIKQNQSEVSRIQFSVSYWIVTSICKATFYRKPQKPKTRHVAMMKADIVIVATNDARWMLRNEARYRN